MQQKEIKYTGITTTPSDYDCPDGDLSIAINAISENDSLQPITLPKTLFKLPPGMKVIFIHKTITSTHYIIESKKEDNLQLQLSFFTDENPLEVKEILTLESKANSISVLGNVLCIATDNTIKYAFWNEEKYKVFDSSKFKYDISLKYQNAYSTIPSSNDNGIATNESVFGIDIGDAYPNSNPMTKVQARNLFIAADALINSHLSTRDKYTFKYMSLGVAALKSFSGTYLSISNVFLLSPRGGIQYSSQLYMGNDRAIFAYYEPYREKVLVNMDLEGIEDIISSIDIFLTPPFTLFDIDKKYNWKRGSSGMTFDMKSQEKIYEEIDGMIFRKSISIEKKDFGKEIFLEQVSNAGEKLSLADFKRKKIGAKYTFSYNNRLNLANTRSQERQMFDIAIKQKNYKIQTAGGYLNTYQDGTTAWISYEETFPFGNMYGQYADLYQDGEFKSSKEIEEKNVDAIVIIYSKKNGIEQTQIHNDVIQYPLSPLFMFPDANAYKAEIYIYDSQKNKYKKRIIQLYQSKTSDMALYININDKGFPSFLQYMDVTIDIDPCYGDGGLTTYKEGTITTKESGTWETTTKEEFEQHKKRQEKDVYFDESYIKYSEVNNPFSFPSSNTVSIGTDKILGINSAVKALSQGQFGQFPLYAFTNQGIWALEVSNTGSYTARQPVTRDVCNNLDSITQIDTAVLFTSDRGIMLIQGSESICISELLNEKAFDITTLRGCEQLAQMTGLTIEHLKHSNFIEYIKGCAISYDYTKQRIIVFNKDYFYAYVYSLKSKTWSMMQSNFINTVNSYPDSYIMTKDNTLVNISNAGNEHSKTVKGIIITRPLKLDSPDLLKTITQSIHRGVFEKGHVKSVLYGSRDCINFVPITSSTDHTIRSIHGSPYKYFRFAIITELLPGESLSGTSIIFETRQTNKLR